MFLCDCRLLPAALTLRSFVFFSFSRVHLRQPTSRQLSARLRLWPRPRSRLNTMTLVTIGAKTVTSPLVPCLIFSRTCIAKLIERFVPHTFIAVIFFHVCVIENTQNTFFCRSYSHLDATYDFLFFSPQTLDPYNRPWASAPIKIVKNMPSEEKLTKPAKGTRTSHLSHF